MQLKALPQSLCSDFILSDFGNDAAERLGARQREGHVPKIDVGGEEFEANVGLAVALALNGSNVGLDFARAIFVDEQQHLTENQGMFGFNLRAVLADRIGLHPNGELFGVLVLSVDYQRDSEGDTLSAPALFAAKVK